MTDLNALFPPVIQTSASTPAPPALGGSPSNNDEHRVPSSWLTGETFTPASPEPHRPVRRADLHSLFLRPDGSETPKLEASPPHNDEHVVPKEWLYQAAPAARVQQSTPIPPTELRRQ
jgi:hypothetical protein